MGPDFGDGDESSIDENGHGTEVANTIEQFWVTNGLLDGRIVSIKATQGSSADATLGAIASSLNWVLQNHQGYGIDAINISLGFGSSSKGTPISLLEPYFKLLEEAGVFIAIAAGNDYGPNSSEGISSLAASQYVTAVGATWDRNAGYQSFSTGAIDYSTGSDRIASFSQRDEGLDIFAPGGAIVTKDINGNLVVRSGTSYAVAQVTAGAAIIRAMADEAGVVITPSEIRELLRSTGRMIFDGDDEDDNVPNTYRYYPLLDTQAAISEMRRRINAFDVVAVVQPQGMLTSEPLPGPDLVNQVKPSSDIFAYTPSVSIQGNSGLGDPVDPWSLTGNATVSDTTLRLDEHSQLISGAQRTYTLDPSKNSFQFQLHNLFLNENGPDQAPDAFEVALRSGSTFVNRVAALGGTDALLNIQADGRYYAGPGVTVVGTELRSGVLDLTKAIDVTVDVSQVASGTEASLSFDLIGFGIASSSVQIDLPEGEQIPNNSIAGFVYVDANNNGLFDSGELPISGVTVALSGTETRTTTTTSDGSYRFLGLIDGTYTVSESQPAGFNDGQESAGQPLLGVVQNDRFVGLVLSGNNTQAINYNFGELAIAQVTHSLGGFVYVDANDNGLFDTGEQPLSGVTITLSGDANRTLTTNASGAYLFTALPSGNYTLTETQPAGYNDGRETQGTPALGTVGNDQFVNIELAGSSIAAVNYNFGERSIVVQPSNSISGFVYVDANDNGVFDSGELPISGASLSLTGPVNRSTTTGTDGSYRFTALPDGVYSVTENQVAGFADGKETQGQPALGTVENDRFVGLNLSGNVALVNYNFGEREIVVVQNNSISGSVYVDVNNNGLFEATELGIAGVVIELTGPRNLTVVTDASGNYRFASLPDGTYTVTQQQPSGYNDGRETQGTPALGTVGNDQFTVLSLIGGATQLSNYNFGELPIANAASSISGHVYIDFDQNGLYSGEIGLRVVEIRLTGPVNRTVLTDENGFYIFRDLPAGSYSLFEVQPAPYDDGQESLGNLGGTILPDGFSDILLDGTNVGTGYNFGEFLRPRPSINSIGGIVYLDINNNGVRDAVELVVPNVQITLSGAVVSTTFTAEDGTYVFNDLPDGVYSVVETHPVDFLDGIDSVGTGGGGTAGNDRIDGILLEKSASAINYNFAERGLLQPNKTHLLASTPPAEQIIREKMLGLSRSALSDNDTLPGVGHNPHFSLDVSSDGYVSPLDALLVINVLNSQSPNAPRGQRGYTAADSVYVDTNGDGLVSPMDVLLVINYLNYEAIQRVRGEGESSAIDTTAYSSVQVELDIDLRSTFATLAPIVERTDMVWGEEESLYADAVETLDSTPDWNSSVQWQPTQDRQSVHDEAMLDMLQEQEPSDSGDDDLMVEVNSSQLR